MNPILVQLARIGAPVARSLLAKGISRRAFLKFSVDTGKFIALSEVIDTAAEYNDWLKENKEYVLIAAALSSPISQGVKGARAVVARRLKNPSFFSKMKVAQGAARARAAFGACKLRPIQGGTKIQFPNGEELVIQLKNNQLAIAGFGSLIVPALLAAGFGGEEVNDVNSKEFVASVEQIAAVGCHFLHQHSRAEIIDRCRSMSPLSLLSGARAIAESMRSEFSFVSQDEICACIMTALQDEEISVGEYWIDSFIDESDDLFFTINGLNFGYDGERLIIAEPNGRRSTPLNAQQVRIESCLADLLSAHSADQLEMTLVPEKNEFYSYPATMGDVAVSLAWDQANNTLSFVVTNDSLFDSAVENMQDVAEPSIAEEIEFASKAAVRKSKDLWNSIFGEEPDDRNTVTIGGQDVRNQIKKELNRD